VLGYRLDDQALKSQQWLGNFLFTPTTRPIQGPMQPPSQWVPGPLQVKGLGHEADHSPPSSAKVKNV